MGGNLRGELSLYARLPVEVARLGLNLGSSFGELHLPPNPAKQTDSRYAEYVQTTGQTDLGNRRLSTLVP